MRRPPCVSVARVARRWATGGVFAVVALTGERRQRPAQVAPPAPERLAVGDWELAPVVELRVRPEYRRDLDEERLRDARRAGAARASTRSAGRSRRGSCSRMRGPSISARTRSPLVGPGLLAVTGAFEAWGEAHTDSMRPSFVRVGRQPITWGEGRLLGRGGLVTRRAVARRRARTPGRGRRLVRAARRGAHGPAERRRARRRTGSSSARARSGRSTRSSRSRRTCSRGSRRTTRS